MENGVTLPSAEEGQDPCSALSEDAHRTWRAFSELRSRGGNAKRTPNQVAEHLRIKPSIVRHHIGEITDAGLARFEDGHISIDPGTECPHRGLSVRSRGLVRACTGMPTPVTPSTSTSTVGNPSPSVRSIPLAASGDERSLYPEAYSRVKTARSLVEYFRLQCTKNYWGMTPGALNEDALRSQITRWLRMEGIPYDTVKAMIDVFTSDRNFIRQDTPAWKSFVNQRQKLFLIAEERTKRAKIDSRWTGSGKVTFKGFMPRHNKEN